MKKNKKQAVTLIELVVVVIVISIFIGILVPQFTKSRERTMDREAQEILMVIRAAERNYKLKTGEYYGGSVSGLNTNLDMDLVDDGEWTYSVSGTAGSFSASLSRNKGGYARTWSIDSTSTTPTCSGACP